MSKQITFKKMHGLGNDFIILDAVNQDILITAKQIKKLSNRRTGIGFDQCLIVAPSPNPEYDFYYRIFNADGSEVGQCGNGARCLALFIKKLGLSDKPAYRVLTQSSSLLLKPLTDSEVWVEFDEPQFSYEAIPIDFSESAASYPFDINGQQYHLHCVNVGNPHGILLVDKLSDELIESLGEALSTHPKFIDGANISFVEQVNEQTAKIRVYERGVGETQACGSAALATAACLQKFHNGATSITIKLPGGTLDVHWQGSGHKISFIGSATDVFDGTIIL